MARLQGGWIIEAARINDSDLGCIVGASLKSLREKIGLTQNVMAQRLGIDQAAIAKIERKGGVQISSLQKYVEALGATLYIGAAPPAESPASFDGNSLDKKQLVLPFCGNDFFRTPRDIVLSIAPQYTEKIMEGRKTAELRRRFPITTSKGALAYIYSTSPVRAMVGSAVIADVVKLPVPEIWNQYHDQAFIKKADFDAYFAGLKEGFVLELKNVRPLPRALELAELRERFGFKPPQSFHYAEPGLRKTLPDEYPKISHRYEHHHRA